MFNDETRAAAAHRTSDGPCLRVESRNAHEKQVKGWMWRFGIRDLCAPRLKGAFRYAFETPSFTRPRPCRDRVCIRDSVTMSHVKLE